MNEYREAFTVAFHMMMSIAFIIAGVVQYLAY